jgi:DHA1 family inner membrane transport protein
MSRAAVNVDAAVLSAGRLRARSGLMSLDLGSFVVGTAELLVVGVVALVARDMKVSVGTAGGLVTACALGISFCGPLLTAATIRLDRRRVLWLALAAYAAVNVLAVGAGSFGVLLAGRAITGSMHGLFIGVASAVAAGLVSEDKQGQAMAAVMGGITIAIGVGVPLGTALGSTLGWRAAFVAVVVLGLIAHAATVVLVPSVSLREPSAFSLQARAALSPPVWAVLAIGLVMMCGSFTAFTYLAPYLEKVTGISSGAVSAFLLIYGLAAAAWTFLGGRAADRSAARTLIAANALLVVVLGLLYLLGSTPIMAAVLLAAWGIAGFGLAPHCNFASSAWLGQAATLPRPSGHRRSTWGSRPDHSLAAASSPSTAHELGSMIVCVLVLPAVCATSLLGRTASTELSGQNRNFERPVPCLAAAELNEDRPSDRFAARPTGRSEVQSTEPNHDATPSLSPRSRGRDGSDPGTPPRALDEPRFDMSMKPPR